MIRVQWIRSHTTPPLWALLGLGHPKAHSTWNPTPRPIPGQLAPHPNPQLKGPCRGEDRLPSKIGKTTGHFKLYCDRWIWHTQKRYDPWIRHRKWRHLVPVSALLGQLLQATRSDFRPDLIIFLFQLSPLLIIHLPNQLITYDLWENHSQIGHLYQYPDLNQ